MKAFVYGLDARGKDRLRTGRVSPYYVNYGNFMRHFMRKLPPGRYRAYIYKEWAHRYAKPDMVQVITVQPKEVAYADVTTQ